MDGLSRVFPLPVAPKSRMLKTVFPSSEANAGQRKPKKIKMAAKRGFIFSISSIRRDPTASCNSRFAVRSLENSLCRVKASIARSAFARLFADEWHGMLERRSQKPATARTPDGKMPGASRSSPREIQHCPGETTGPSLERIDLRVEVPQVKFREIAGGRTGETSAQIRERVIAARQRQ
jgi:hypothetical protein